MGRKVTAGVFWNLGGVFASRGASTIFMLFLAGLLAPEAFGLIAMVVVVFSVTNVFIDSGLSQALIRSKQVSDADLDTVFISNIVISVIVYIVVYFCAPFIASFYAQPELELLVRIMALSLLVNATKLVQLAILSRQMNFKVQMKADTIGVVISGVVAVGAAYIGAGVWALVIQLLVSGLVSAIIIWWCSNWKPALRFSQESFKNLFGFGIHILTEGILSQLYQNSSILVIGRFFTTELTGLYFFADRLSKAISQQITNAVQKVTYPALATLQDENEQLLYKYRQIIQIITFLISPAMLILAGIAPPLFSLLFDEPWHAAVPYMQLMCIGAVLYPIHSINLNILKVKGRPDLVVKVGLVKKGVNLSLLFLAIPYGVFGIVVSQLIGSFFSLVPNAYYSVKLIDYSFSKQFADVMKPIFSASIAGLVVVYFVQISTMSYILNVALGLSIGLVVYLLVSCLTRSEGLVILARIFPTTYFNFK